MTAPSDPAPVQVWCEYLRGGFADWVAECRLCDARLFAGDHEGCLTWALGHLSFRHSGT